MWINLFFYVPPHSVNSVDCQQGMFMKTILALAFAATLAAAPFSFAADPAPHDEHHPDAPAVRMAPNKTANAMGAPKATNQQMGAMDAQMKTMREAHEKMMEAKSPDERNALMAEHMKCMQDGMSMLSDMTDTKSSKAKPMSPQMMQKQMAMMQMMMQMMMDRVEAQAPSK